VSFMLAFLGQALTKVATYASEAFIFVFL